MFGSSKEHDIQACQFMFGKAAVTAFHYGAQPIVLGVLIADHLPVPANKAEYERLGHAATIFMSNVFKE